MHIPKENFLIQAKYSDLSGQLDRTEAYSLGFGGELYFDPDEITHPDPKIIESINAFVKVHHLPLRLHAPIIDIDYLNIEKTISCMQDIYKKVIDLSKRLGIKDVVTHADIFAILESEEMTVEPPVDAHQRFGFLHLIILFSCSAF
ncbi:hypothetical protein ACFL3J_03075, partial [Candidatus Omnitrophota bacterium]